MPLSIILGVGLLIGIILILRSYANAELATLKRVIKWILISIIVLFALFLALTGRFGVAFGLFIGAIAWGWRLFNVISRLQQIMRLFSSFAGLRAGFGSSGQAQPGQSSRVKARFILMTLDHDTGFMDGEVLDGPFQGQLLSAMPIDDLLSLYQLIKTDTDSLRLLEAFLDRSHVGWRNTEGFGAEFHGGADDTVSSATMTLEEAYHVLGLERGATKRDIKAAYRYLMTKVHPDRGGSAYLAAKINEAKAQLMKE